MTGARDPLQELLDRQAIHDVLLRYCRGCDRFDRELIAGAFHPDGIDDHGVLRSGAELADMIVAMDPAHRHFHLLGNVLIELEGTTAFSEAYFTSVRSFERDGRTFTRTKAGRYVDRFERRGRVWAIAHRVVVDDWSRVDEVTEAAEDVAHLGAKRPDDWVYALRERSGR